MTTPFEKVYREWETALESWMTVPFENDTAEELVVVESWMTTPFSAEVDNSPVYGSETDTRP
jgi:hypothetical protein